MVGISRYAALKLIHIVEGESCLQLCTFDRGKTQTLLDLGANERPLQNQVALPRRELEGNPRSGLNPFTL